jgi:NO-binding membrane sensor protein with MHYT domain
MSTTPVMAAAARARPVLAAIVAALHFTGAFSLPVAGMVSFVVAGFILHAALGFALMGVSFFALRWLIEAGERGQAAAS